MVLVRKLDDYGRIANYKLRLVANSYTQKDGVAYDKKFAPVIQFDVLLLIVGKFTSAGWPIHHADIYITFLNGDIDGELYVRRDSICYKFRRLCMV